MKILQRKFKFLALTVVSMVVMMMLAACGDSTATTAPTTTAAATATKAATTAAATTAATGTTTAAGATTAAATTAAGATTAAATTAAGATTAAATGSGTIRIYSSLPMTGSSKEQIDTVINAMKLALADATGGTNKIGNYTIDYVPLDDATAAAGKWDADQEKANANKAANDADAMVYLGTFNSGAAKISIPILNQAGMAMISPANTYTGLTTSVGAEAGEPDLYYPTKVRTYFRVIGNDALQGPADAEFLKSLGAKSVYILDDGEAYGKGIADTTAAGLKAQGITVAARVTINGKAPDYKSQAADIKAKNPDAIFYGGITQNQAGKLVGDIRAAGIKVPFLGPDGINEDAFIKDAGAAGEGVYSSVGGLPDDKLGPKAQDFVTRYKAKYGSTQAYTIYGYETMNVALAAIKKAGVKDRKAILSALQNLGEFDGVLGKWSFDKNGDTTLGDFIVTQVKDGKWVQVSYIRPKPLS